MHLTMEQRNFGSKEMGMVEKEEEEEEEEEGGKTEDDNGTLAVV